MSRATRFAVNAIVRLVCSLPANLTTELPEYNEQYRT